MSADVATIAVENYLKHVLLLSDGGEDLVPMGALAAALAVVPGTVTTMVKALDDDGLLLLSCNDRDVAVADVLTAAQAGAKSAGRVVKTLGELPLPADITSKDAPRGRPMRGVVLRVR